jgi:hypothetical protein
MSKDSITTRKTCPIWSGSLDWTTPTPEYYLDQENNSDESEDKDENYRDSTTLLLDMIETNLIGVYPILFSSAVFCY